MARTEDEERRNMKRKRIMQAALRIFSQKGYSPTALDEIAQEAGIAKGTLYLYFKDKEDLICSTLISVLDDIKERMMERISEDMDPVETLGEIARALFEYFSENNEFYNVYLTILNYNLVSNYTTLFDRMLARKKELYQFESQLVDAAKDLGSIRRDLATEDIVMAFDGIVMNIIDQMFFLRSDSTFDPREKAGMVMHLFLEGVGKQKG
jgi:TetR/AcrR family fatty acid metabolism transcriptional regulator